MSGSGKSGNGPVAPSAPSAPAVVTPLQVPAVVHTSGYSDGALTTTVTPGAPVKMGWQGTITAPFDCDTLPSECLTLIRECFRVTDRYGYGRYQTVVFAIYGAVDGVTPSPSDPQSYAEDKANFAVVPCRTGEEFRTTGAVVRRYSREGRRGFILTICERIGSGVNGYHAVKVEGFKSDKA